MVAWVGKRLRIAACQQAVRDQGGGHDANQRRDPDHPGAHRRRAVLYRPEILYYEMAPGSGTPLPADGRTGAWLPSARRIMTNTGDQPAGKRAAPAIVAD